MDLVFRGELLPGVAREEAVTRLARLLRQPPDVIESRLFTGRPVRIKTVSDESEAKRYVDAFAAAGAKLEMRPSASRTASSSRPKGPSKGTGRRRRPGWGIAAMVALVLLGALSAAGAWYTQPIWRAGVTSAVQVRASRALATEDLVALGHLDVERASRLHDLLYGERDPGALLTKDDDLWASLARAGVDVREQIDDALVAFYSDGEHTGYAVVLLGRLAPDAMREWIGSRYQIDRFDPQTNTVYFSWLDEKTCERVPLKAARLSADRVLVASADRLDALWQRLQTSVQPLTPLNDWLTLAEEQLLTLGVFVPDSMGDAADGVAGMMLEGAGEATAPASALYAGASPALIPPGIVFRGSIASDDQAFLERSHAAATAWLTRAKESAASDWPELVDLYDRLSVSRTEGTLRGAVRLDTDIDDELQKLIAAAFSRAFRVSPSQQGGTSGQTTEQVAEDPQQFRDVSPEQLEPFSHFGDAHFTPQWEGGPFAVAVSKLALDEDGALALELRAEGRGLPNVGPRSKLVRLKVTDVVDRDGNSLLAEGDCGPSDNRAWSEFDRPTEGARFENGNTIRFPTVSVHKKISLAPGARARDVAAIRGEIEYQMPTRVRRVRVPRPLSGEVVETQNLRLRFQGGSETTISYHVSGETQRLIAVRALNARDQILASNGATWGDNWFGGGQHASLDFKGQVGAAELVVADALEPQRYSFELPHAFPPIRERSRRDKPAPPVATPAALSRAMQQPPPEVTFEYNEPVQTVPVGPALLTLQQMRVSSFLGLYAQMALYVRDDVPLEGQLNGATIALDRAVSADGESVDLDHATPVNLAADGAYWVNGEYTRDPDRPWLKGTAGIQQPGYEAEAPSAIHGRLVFRAPRDVRQVELSSEPGSRWSGEGVRLAVNEWQENVLYLDVETGADRVVSVRAIDVEGNPADRGSRLEGAPDKRRVRVDLSGLPRSLHVLVATDTVEHERSFVIRLEPQ